MTTRWTRVCPDCGNNDGAKVKRIAFHPTFRCECGYVWDGSKGTFVGLWKVDGSESDEERRGLVGAVAGQMIAVVQHRQG